MAQALKPWSTKLRNAACKVTGSGVVNPLDFTCPGSPTPSVPTTPQRRPSRLSACAIHHAQEVLPLVPVMATVSKLSLGSL